ncbi:MAG: ABC transporter substrate-binding protein [Micrococcales bacterium]
MKRLLLGLLALSLSVLTLTSCSQPAGLVKGSSLVIGEGSYLSNINSAVLATTGQMRSNSDLAILTMPSFYSVDANGELVANEAFGTVTAVGNKVTYKLSGNAVWSDGKPVSEGDLALAWAAAVNESQAGFNSISKTSSLALATADPVISPNQLQITYPILPPDWKTALQITVPAHLVANQVFKADSTSDTDTVLLQNEAIKSGDSQKLALVASAFNTITALNTSKASSSLDGDLLVSAGPYLIEKASAQEAQLVVNPKFTWGPLPTVERLTVKCFNGTKRLLAALNRGELDLAMPVETITTSYAQILTSLDAASDLGVSYQAGVSQTQEVMLFSYRSRSAFAYNLSKSNAKLVEAARDAFKLYVPRSGFVTTLSPGSALTRSDSLVFSPGTEPYKATVKTNGTSDLRFQQAELASEVLIKAGHTEKVPIRVLFDSKNPRGQIEFGILDRYSKASGFVLQNVSSDNPSQTFADGSWDVFITNQQLIGSSSTALASALGSATGFKNDSVNKVVASLSKSKDLANETSKLERLDQLLVQNGFALPLFTLPNSVAYSKKLEKYVPNISTQSLVNGYWNWVVSAPAK